MHPVFTTCDFPPRVGGVAVYGQQLAMGMAQQNGVDRVTVVAYGDWPDGVEHPVERLTILRRKDRGFVCGGLDLISQLFKLKPDAIHILTIFPQGPWATLAGRMLQRPIFASLYGTDGVAHGSGLTSFLKRYTLKSASSLMPISQATAGRAQRSFQLDPAHMEIIPPGLTALESSRPGDPCRADLGLADNDFVIMTLTRLVFRKGVDVLIKAVAGLPRHFKLVIVGDGGERTKLERLVQETGIEDRVIFTGLVKRAAPFYELADLFVLASYEDEASGDVEGFGIVLLEAAFFGLPVIATNSGGMPEAMSANQTGLLVPPQDSQTLTDAIASLAGDDTLRQEFGRVGRERAMNDFSWTKLAARHLAVYEAHQRG